MRARISFDHLYAKRNELLDLIAVKKNYQVTDQFGELYKTRIIDNPRMRTAAGRAFISDNKIELNGKMLLEHPDELEPTFVHELAHLISIALYGARGAGHGRYWRATMRMLGQEPTRCHSMSETAPIRRHRVMAYAICACNKAPFPIKPRRFAKIQKGVRYRCMTCFKSIEIVGKNGNAR